MHLRDRNVTRMELGYRMFIDGRVPEMEPTTRSGQYEDRTVKHCLRLVSNNGVFFDIGANIGIYTCAFATRRWRFRGRIYAFEPVRANFEALLRNVRLNRLQRRVTAVHGALGNYQGRLLMRVMPEGETNNAVGDNMMTDHDRQNVADQAWRSEEAPIFRLDDWADHNEIKRCDVMKMDVEGAEYFVLEGGLRFVARHRPVIVGEFNPYWMKQIGKAFDDVRRLLADLDYASFIFCGERYVPVTEQSEAKGLEIPTYLLVPREKASRVDQLR